VTFPFNDTPELQAARNRWAGLDENVSRLSSQRAAVLEEMAKMACPYKVGQVLERDKERRQRGSWTRIRVKERVSIEKIKPNEHAPFYTLVGRVFRKDGTLGDRVTVLWAWENWVPEKEEAKLG